jgi:hypothetical protein
MAGMIAEIKNIVDIVTSAVRSTDALRRSSRRKELYADLLEAYFHFSAVKKNGTMLLDLAGAEPVEKVSKMPAGEAKAYVDICQRLIIEQQKRLYRLNELLQAQALLDIFGPDFRRRVDDIIGTKEKGLLGAAAGVEFYLIFGGGLSKADDVEAYGKEKAVFRYQGRIVLLIVGTDQESEVIDLEKARTNLRELELAAEELRKIIAGQCDPDTLIELTNAAEARAGFSPTSKKKGA